MNRLKTSNKQIQPIKIKKQQHSIGLKQEQMNKTYLEFYMEWKWKMKMKSRKTYVVEAREEEHATWKVNGLQDEGRLPPLKSSQRLKR